MKDPSLFLLLGITCILFAGFAAYAHKATLHLSRRTRIKPPHPTLITVTRVWFALLALGCLILLVLPLFQR